MLHEKLEEYNSAFEKIMEELEEPEMPKDPKSSAPSTTDKTPKKSRGQYQKPTDKNIKKLLSLQKHLKIIEFHLPGIIDNSSQKITTQTSLNTTLSVNTVFAVSLEFAGVSSIISIVEGFLTRDRATYSWPWENTGAGRYNPTLSRV
ncbi:hypothetical protein PHYBLDRAFT_165409 [Phycomyces blakesleeanus NRRL 1555(-)]|uniref:Uncharacterized protein n=1 Tax=Phycomyces blakesleeanus (strain ATCC 8743b / DSM 1359 / FGSC 10004 / NBRC 33097 / NRRL 1555) TaxID=763407 RepID=A0A167NZ06_PHYB8|nr:hypothetical protein PHYBLDRAFT_165409 [Phycomyces blakesleeanus NRRL 1555(-)]OAD76911.1 hypothetical protein PHYBLDRAFT_165409 [Phycomyces blakesleeanus NRRL 1555(-)]|eukprot:XP_018294951.1 hypothetical protein PHYBLDRAFT_165409 [Phycomyces blakesleeanus NRRL 1555(-)]